MQRRTFIAGALAVSQFSVAGAIALPTTHMGVIYGTRSRVASRLIYPQTEAETAILLAGWPGVREGESIAIVPRALLGRFTHVEAVIEALVSLGGPRLLPGQRAALVDANGLVVDIRMADVSIALPPEEIAPHVLAQLRASNPSAEPTLPLTFVVNDTANIGDVLEIGA